jgi:hypothetical protein
LSFIEDGGITNRAGGFLGQLGSDILASDQKFQEWLRGRTANQVIESNMYTIEIRSLARG